MVLKTALTACLCLSLLGESSAQQAGPAPADLSPVEILARMRDVYANCTSYRDAGVVHETFTHPANVGSAEERVRSIAGLNESSKPFRTAFLRPGKFRFEYSESRFGKLSHYIVWEDGADVRTWWDVAHGERTPGSLGMAIAGATGVSSAAAHTVPRMLTPLQVSGTVVTELLNPERLADAPLDDVVCCRVKGMFAGSAPTTLWIDHDSFLLRRVEREVDIKDFHVSTITTYEPEIDVEIGRGELAFDPPTGIAEPAPRHDGKLPSEAEVAPRFRHALELVDAANYDAALTEFKWLWDSTNNPRSAFEPYIRDPIIEAIGRLAVMHPATQAYFGAIFDELDATVRKDARAFRAWTDWADLGRALKLDDRIVQLYLDRRSPAGTLREFDDIHPYAMDDLLDILIERKLYADAGRLYADPVKQAEICYSSFDSPAEHEVDVPAPAALRVAREEVSRLHALTLAAERTSEAEDIARLMLLRDDTVEARRALVLACLHMEVPCASLPGWIAEIRRRGGDVDDIHALMTLPAEASAEPGQR